MMIFAKLPELPLRARFQRKPGDPICYGFGNLYPIRKEDMPKLITNSIGTQSIWVKDPELVNSIKDGIIKKLSVGFHISTENYLCAECDKPIFTLDCPHVESDYRIVGTNEWFRKVTGTKVDAWEGLS